MGWSRKVGRAVMRPILEWIVVVMKRRARRFVMSKSGGGCGVGERGRDGSG